MDGRTHQSDQKTETVRIVYVEPWYLPTTYEVECRECGTIYDYDMAKDLPCCPKCHGQE